MRRILAPILASLLVLAGCGGGDSESSDTSGPSVDTKFGSVDVPADPQRVVALGWGDAETALALGVQPVGASDWVEFGGMGVGPWAEDLYDEAPDHRHHETRLRGDRRPRTRSHPRYEQ